MEGNHFHIQGEAIQFISNANLVQQNHNLPSAPSPLVEENGGGNDSSTTYGLYVQRRLLSQIRARQPGYGAYGSVAWKPVPAAPGHLHLYGPEPMAERVRPDSPSPLYGERFHQSPRTLQRLFPQAEGTDASWPGGDFRHLPITPVPGHFGGRHRHRGTLRPFLHHRPPRPLADHTQPENLRDVRGVDGAEVGRKRVDR